ncbi:hypothetical protein OIU85_012103 [Salix viminalis]|uniref:Uncharacterized protein n=1 Tax=Salix viminalis TaxID=40686 RepID=A0A9Q0NHY4_SALVM|nr:hypothetical protein OIU85_012103 [Salix viminalis]
MSRGAEYVLFRGARARHGGGGDGRSGRKRVAEFGRLRDDFDPSNPWDGGGVLEWRHVEMVDVRAKMTSSLMSAVSGDSFGYDEQWLNDLGNDFWFCEPATCLGLVVKDACVGCEEEVCVLGHLMARSSDVDAAMVNVNGWVSVMSCLSFGLGQMGRDFWMIEMI